MMEAKEYRCGWPTGDWLRPCGLKAHWFWYAEAAELHHPVCGPHAAAAAKSGCRTNQIEAIDPSKASAPPTNERKVPRMTDEKFMGTKVIVDPNIGPFGAFINKNPPEAMAQGPGPDVFTQNDGPLRPTIREALSDVIVAGLALLGEKITAWGKK